MGKAQERAELHRAIWQIANDLRGSVDGWDFKSYVLGILFYRFISESLTDYINKAERESDPSFDYADLLDLEAEPGRASTVREKGFFILPSQLFVNVLAGARGDQNLNEKLAHIFKAIEGSAVGTESEEDIKGLFADIDVNSNKLRTTVIKRNEKLVQILEAIGGLDLGQFGTQSIDTFGDAYEFLMTMYASGAGKSGGEFFTPQEVAELLAKIAIDGKRKINKVYDPACGSGSLLLKFSKLLGLDHIEEGFFGQEINITTYNLCRINMFLHGVSYEKFSIALGDTLTEPKHWDDRPFDAIVSNPPYSIKWAGDANPLLINDERFNKAGVLAPKSKADLAFVMHSLSWLSQRGTAAIVSFPGVLYRGGAEEKIRDYLIKENFVDTVIQLPPNLFFGTSIATCILVLKKNKKNNDILFINASEKFVHEGNKNKLSPENIEEIFNIYRDRRDVAHIARLVPCAEVLANGANLSVSSYIEPENKEEPVDIEQLNKRIAEIVERQNALRRDIDRIIAELGRL